MNESTIEICSIAVSTKKGVRKTPVNEARLIENHGIEGDAHAGDWHRQVSFLAAESIDKMKQKGLDVTFGDFAENIATSGIDWKAVAVGRQFKVGNSAIVEITQIGKTCHKPCSIYYQAGECIMPQEGVFARVSAPGTIRCGDRIVPVDPSE